MPRFLDRTKRARRSTGATLPLAFAFLLVAGCYEHHVVVDESTNDAGRLEPLEHLDLLILVDDSNSMADEQAALRRELPQLFSRLLTGDVDGDGLADRRPARSVNVGVVSTDMGVLGVGLVPAPLDPNRTTSAIAGCGAGAFGVDADQALRGDDGRILLDAPERAILAGEGLSCPNRFDDFLRFSEAMEPTPAQIQAFADRAACVAVRGTGGCGFEMPLEAALKAVTPSDAPLRFGPDGTPGHGPPSGAHAGFFRPSSVIAVLMLSDEDDCSTPDPEIFMFSPRETSLQDPEQVGLRFNTRCAFFEERLHAIERYVSGLLALRDDPSDIVVGAIVGVPDGTRNDTAEGYAALLADPRMQHRYRYLEGVDSNLDGRDDVDDLFASVYFVPACHRCVDAAGAVVPDDGIGGFEGCLADPTLELQSASPGRRFVSLLAGLRSGGARTVLRPICGDDLSEPIGAFANEALDALAN